MVCPRPSSAANPLIFHALKAEVKMIPPFDALLISSHSAFVASPPSLWKPPAHFHKNTCSFSPSKRRARCGTTFLLAENDDAHHSHGHEGMPPRIYEGPVLSDPNGIIAGFALDEIGVDLAVAPSEIAPGTYGLFVALGEGVESTTIPSMQLLSGYSREGTFHSKDSGDKTVGFALAGPETAVFFERQLMSVLDALQLAAENQGEGGACGLAGHVLVQDENGEIDVFVDTDDTEFKRYFVPALMNRENEDEQDKEEHEDNDATTTMDISVANLGQFCNDLAWSYEDPPESKEDYDSISLEKNAIQLVWRLEFNTETNCLVPTWPVSVVADDLQFKNEAFMELGTKYGWNYWQATVDMEELK